MNKDARDYFWAVVENKIVSHIPFHDYTRSKSVDYLSVLVEALANTCEVFDIKPRKAEQSEPEASKV